MNDTSINRRLATVTDLARHRDQKARRASAAMAAVLQEADLDLDRVDEDGIATVENATELARFLMAASAGLPMERATQLSQRHR
ncbi:MAG: hypothetical protein Q4G45_00725 [Actinomycetia bacterium]|nr:hypothetical protein [Actinomycetes bacterium]